MSGYDTPLTAPPLAYQFCHLWEGCGLGVEAAPLLPLFLGTGPLRQQAARACPGVTPKGGCGQEQGAHSAAAATSGQPTGWPGRGGREETGKGRDRDRDRHQERQRQTLGERQRNGDGETDGDPERDTWPLGCTSRLPGSPVESLRLAQPPARKQSPEVLLDPAPPGAHSLVPKSCKPRGGPGTFWGGP